MGTLGEKIRQIRLEKGMTMEEFAESLKRINPKSSTGKSNVSRWERGENIPNDLTLQAIAELAGITVAELLGDCCEVKASSIKNRRKLYVTSCGHTFESIVFANAKFCPFCGKQLKIKEEQ